MHVRDTEERPQPRVSHVQVHMVSEIVTPEIYCKDTTENHLFLFSLKSHSLSFSLSPTELVVCKISASACIKSKCYLPSENENFVLFVAASQCLKESLEHSKCSLNIYSVNE